MKPHPDKAALLDRVAGTRAALADDLTSLGSALGSTFDLRSRVRSSFGRHPLVWIAGAVVLGVAVSTLFRKRGAGGGFSKWRPMLLGGLGFLGNRLISLSLPALQQLVETEVTRWISRRQTQRPETPPEVR